MQLNQELMAASRRKHETHVACGREEAGCAVAAERRGDREVIVAVEIEARQLCDTVEQLCQLLHQLLSSSSGFAG